MPAFYKVLGLSGTATGIVMFLAVLWDAISDPLIGAWPDRSRWGRRHPYMIAGAFPMGWVLSLCSPRRPGALHTAFP